MAWAYPQKEDGLRFLLIRQDWKCIDCQFDYMPFMESVLEKDKAYMTMFDQQLHTISWFYFKRLKRKVPKENRPEVDHIIPVAKGGYTLGLDNHACRCYQCHKKKSKVDNSGPRNKP